ncbi:hypothetical protein [Myxosarcina sp. GI1(2024)]
MSNLIPNEEHCEYYRTRLPDRYLHSDEVYLTKADYQLLQALDDDVQLDDLEFEYQLSIGAINALNNFRAKAFADYDTVGDFRICMLELQQLIDTWLNMCDLSQIIIG